MAKYKRVRIDELRPGDVDDDHVCLVFLDKHAHPQMAPNLFVFPNEKTVRAVVKPVVRPQPNFSVD